VKKTCRDFANASSFSNTDLAALQGRWKGPEEKDKMAWDYLCIVRVSVHVVDTRRGVQPNRTL